MAASKFHGLTDRIRIPQGGEKVYKDECAYCFANPEHETGLYVCMNTFLGFGKDYVYRYYENTKNRVFLHLKTIKKKKPKTEEEKEKEKPTRLAIGVAGGFDVEDENQYEYEEHNSVVILPEFTTFPLPNAELPLQVQLSVAGILAANSASKTEQIQAWEGDAKIISKHAANLLQLDNGVKVPPKGWKCCMCDLRDNLWMNLTDGMILCGRRYFDGTGGNNHAVEHYEKTKYPLAVKLGTITANGADVYSYDEDAMVEDPFLAKHLAHFGINMMMMEKTDKTMTELEIDLNMRVAEWDTIQESGSQLKPLFGPGLTGLKNLGNSCYLNSVMQVLFSIPDFITRYAAASEQIFALGTSTRDPTGDFNTQMAKLGFALISGEYSREPKTEEGGDQTAPKGQKGIAPRMFKSLVGRGHPEFATNRQQDAQEFLLHLFSIIERNSRGQENPCDSVQFEMEERVQCSQSGQVSYKKRKDYLLALPVPLEAATNLAEVTAYEAKKAEKEAKKERIDPKEIVRPIISLQSCLENFTAEERVEDFYSSAIKAKTTALRSTKLASFPDFLIIQLKKFMLGDDWVPKKLDVSVDMPDELDLTGYRGSGLQPNETELPEEAAAPEPEPFIDEQIVNTLLDMGFPLEACRRAVYKTNNSGAEAAMNWVFEHSNDPDFAAPLEFGQKQKADQPVNEESVAMITVMGFTRDQALRALRETNSNLERAAEWLFSHPEELESPMDTGPGDGAQTGEPKCRDGSGKYELYGFISHMGTSTSCGHYVCHIKKDGRWVIFNDEKVAQSENPPRDLGYLYVYKRI
ncbi:ubiquitin carboxyl-terminal hydrolase 5-like [Diadema setosum]|uniref:ubiquitin carboxyl-terminal hydrolase 5-like n=1 Tax=Diadema setosum TaxID=31175 RepID=UPI003B3A49DF